MKKLFLILALVLAPRWAFALTPTEIGQDIVNQSRITFLKQAQLGWGWNLKQDDAGAPTAILGIYSYRFISANIGWHDPYNQADGYYPSPMVGVALDGLTRAIAPDFSDQVKGYVPAVLQPLWSQLVISYGPLYQVSRGEWSHMLAVNIQFGQ